MHSRLLNVSLQAATLLARFFLVFLLAKYLDPREFGYYGLFVATVSYSIYFVGLDYYVYTTREVLKIPMSQRGGLLKSHMVLCFILYAFFIPLALVFLVLFANWPQLLLLWFVPLLVLEHFNQEANRLLVALSQQITASTVHFVRQGSWVVVAVAAMHFNPNYRELTVVLSLWSIAGVIAVFVTIHKLKSLGVGGWQWPTDWKWLKKGIAVSIVFLSATLAIRGIQTLDRYWLEAISGIEVVGAYVLFISLAGSLLTFLDAGVFSFVYPTLMGLNKDRNFSLIHKKVKQMLLITIACTIVFSLVSLACLPYLLTWIGKESYSAHNYLYPWLLLAIAVNAIGLVPHYALYAMGVDKPIIQSHVVALAIFLLTAFALSKYTGLLAIPIALILAFSAVLFLKTIAYKRFLALQSQL